MRLVYELTKVQDPKKKGNFVVNENSNFLILGLHFPMEKMGKQGKKQSLFIGSTCASSLTSWSDIRFTIFQVLN